MSADADEIVFETLVAVKSQEDIGGNLSMNLRQWYLAEGLDQI